MAVVLIAVAGSHLAPRDPLESVTFLRVGEDWMRPPYPPGVPGYPLGSDQFGRDVLSRLLWAVRPTMTLVITVALIRLLAGTLIGMLSGWHSGRIGRLLDGLIALGLVVPVLLVALAVSTALLTRLGVWAFVLGLGATGWAETGRFVREQTRVIRGETFIEAARALGGSDLHILRRHVAPQIAPRLGMLLAFETSSVLLIVAGLGFLGYYVGGAVWLENFDSVFERYSALPELGEMLGSNLGDIFTGPWRFVGAGTMILFITLGFNLLGEGLRLRLSHTSHHRSVLARAMSRLEMWAEDRLPQAASNRWSHYVSRVVWLALVIASFGLGAAWGRSQGPLAVASDTPTPQAAVAAPPSTTATRATEPTSATRAGTPTSASTPQTNVPADTAETTPPLPVTAALDGAPSPLVVPGDHLWVTERRDAYGSAWSPVAGPAAGQILWAWNDPAGLAGPPAIALDGTLYLTGRGGLLHALDTQGAGLWQVQMPATPAGMPTLGMDGRIYVTHTDGSLTAYARDGSQLWRVTPESVGGWTSAPIVAPNGNVYYSLDGEVLAIAPDGLLVWRVRAERSGYRMVPQLSPDGQSIFLGKATLNAQTGTSELTLPSAPTSYLVAPNGQGYLLSGYNVGPWGASDFREVADDRERAADTTIAWDAFQVSPARVEVAGFTASGLLWLNTSHQDRGSLLAWVDGTGLFRKAPYAYIISTQFTAADANDIVYTCGLSRNRDQQCLAFAPDSSRPLWTLVLPRHQSVIGAAIGSERLYVAMQEGDVYAIGTSP